MDDGIELADVIYQLRSELSRAMWSGERSDLRFEARPIELELTMVVQRSTQAGVKAKFVVVDGNADRNHSSTATQRIKLNLQPRLAGNPDGPAYIDGPATPDEE